jgi:N utilization substance protein B
MLNRHFLRAKVLQSLYAYYISQDSDKVQQEKFLFYSINKLYDVEIYLLSALLEIRDIAENQMEDAKNKFFPTEQEKNPSRKFVDNIFIKQIENNKELQKNIKRLHINWADEKDLLKNIFNRFKQSNSYKDYMNSDEASYEEDNKIVCQLFKNYVIKNENLYELLSEKELSWEGDYEYLCQVILKFLKSYKQEYDENQVLSQPFEKETNDEVETDKQFVENLFRNTISHSEEYDELIKHRIENWDMDRLAYIDVIIIKMAITEFIYDPIIPIRVTLNEYIELSKEFSTEKSKLFINGMLDKLVIDLRVQGKIQKIEQPEKEIEEQEEDSKDDK